MTNYDLGIYQLFEGELQVSENLPWYYGLKYIFITTPIIVSTGIILFVVKVYHKSNKKINNFFYAFLFFAFAFPALST